MRVVRAFLTSVSMVAILVLAFGLDLSLQATVVTGCCVLVSLVVHVYAHELGHLAAALSLKLTVTDVAILAGTGTGDGARIGGATVRLGLLGGRSEVRVVAPPGRATSPRHWVALALAGPATNLALAAATGVAMWVLPGHYPAADPTLTQLCLIVSTATGVLIGLGNLIPGTDRRGQPTDGRAIADWLLRPDAARRRATVPVSVALPVPVLTNDPRPSAALAVLRSQVDIGGPAASEAAVELVAAALRVGDLSEDSARLVAVARAVTTPPPTAAFIAAMTAEVQATMLLVNAARAGQTHPEPGPIEEIAELAYARDPQLVEARIALALVRVLQHRPAEARSLLMLVDASAGTARSRVNVVAVRAMAEADLGDLAQARRLIDAGRGVDVPTALLRLATACVDRADSADRQRGTTRSLDHSRQPSS